MTGGFLEGSRALRRNLRIGSDLLGLDLARLCSQGPEADLRSDDSAAAAVIAIGVSAAEELRGRGLEPDGVLGYSLGLYTAAVAAGSLAIETAFALVATIAREGERLFPPGEMSMGFVTGLRVASLEEALADLLERREIAITNVNSPAQVVLAGRSDALDEALGRVRPRAIRSERLAITRPYHSPWMEPVSRVVEDLLRPVEISEPALPLYDHRDGARLATAGGIRSRLAKQLTTRLDWNASISRLVSEGVTNFVEMPPGASTTRMIRWIARDAGALALDEPADRPRILGGIEPPREGEP
jgi:[acyl-carrier-protein] S-malonyltransferase